MDTLYLDRCRSADAPGRTRPSPGGRFRSGAEVSSGAWTAAPKPLRLAPGSSAFSPRFPPYPQPHLTATPAPVYGPFTAIEQPFQLEIAIFPMAEKLLAMSISSNYENELWTLVETDTAYRLEARRFGHGVGMSQRGAEWMAATLSAKPIRKFSLSTIRACP